MKTELQTKLEGLLTSEDNYREEPNYCLTKKIKNGYELDIGGMYTHHIVQMNADKLMSLVTIFGTKKIDVNDYAKSGCETCDWGSDYGLTLQVIKPKKHIEDLEAMVKTTEADQ